MQEQAMMVEPCVTETLIDSLPCTVFVINSEGRLVRWNRKLCLATGYSDSELGSMHSLELVVEDRREAMAEVMRQAFEGALITADVPCLTKDGRIVPYFVVGRRTVIDGLACLVGVGWDAMERRVTEGRFVYEQRLLDTLIDNLPDSIYVKDRESRFVLCNQAVLRRKAVGSLDKIIGRTDFDFDPPDQAQVAYADEQDLIRTGQSLINRERRVIDPVTRKPTWNLTTKAPLRNAANEIVGLVGIDRDITERKCEEEAYRALVDHSLQGLLVIQDMGIVFANRAVERITGYTVEEILALFAESVQDLIHPLDRERIGRYHNARLAGEPAPENYEIRAVRKDGSTRWVEIHANRIEYQGRPAIQVAFIDITDRYRTEEALRRSEARNVALLNANPDLMFRLSAGGVFLDCKPPKDDALSASAAQFIGKHLDEVFSPAITRALMRQIHAAIETGQVQTLEYTLSNGDGEGADFECRLVACAEQEVVAIVRDISDRRRAERLAKLQRDVAIKLSSLSDLKEGLRYCLDAALMASQMDCGGIYLVDEHTGCLNIEVYVGLSQGFVDSAAGYPPQSRNARVVMAGEPQYVAFDKLGVPVGPAQKTEKLRATGIVPIKHDGRVIACLNVASHTADEVPRWSRVVLETIGAQIGSRISRLKMEEALRESEARLRSLLRAAPTGIGLASDGILLEVNDRVCEMLGRRREELTNQEARVLYATNQEYERVDREERLQIDKCGTSTVETRWQRRDGSVIDVLLRSTPLNPADWSTGMTFTALDITERKKAEEARQESERKLRTLLANLPGIAYRCSLTRDWPFDFVSEGSLALTGYTPDELTPGGTVLYGALVHPDDRQKVWDAVCDAVRRDEPFDLEYRIHTKDGQEKWVFERGRAVSSPNAGLPFLEGFITDITEHKRAEAALRESEQNYREVFNAVNDAVIIHDPTTGAVLDVNRKVIEAYGYEYEEALQLKPGGLRPEDPLWRQEEALIWIHKAAKEGPQLFEWLSHKKNGDPVWEEVNLRTATIGGKCRVLAVVRDITDRKKAEAQGQQHLAELTRAWHANMLGEMASGLAHELNQPLCAVVNYSNGCLRLTRKEGYSIETVRNSVEQIAAQAQRAADIVKRIRSLIAKREPQRTMLDLEAILADAVSLLQNEAVKHNVAIVSRPHPDLPRPKGDSVEIGQVVLNLMRNAIETMSDPQIAHRTLTISSQVSNQGEIEVAVADSGRGVSPELSEMVFDSFFTTKPGGLGIGLSLSRRIIESHGGRLWVESDGRSGATFKFTLPVEGAAHGERESRSVRRR